MSLIALGGLLIAATAAIAATPESGTVSKASPYMEWTGTTTAGYFNRIPVLLTEDDSVPCTAPMCDTFALTVADSDDLTITADAPESTGTTGSGSQVTLRIRKPDGSVTIHTTDTPGATPEKPLTVKFRNAPTGDWDVEYFNYFTGSVDYKGTARLGPPPSAPSPTPPQPSPAPQGPPSTGPNQGATPQQDLRISVRTGKVSARKVNRSRRLRATVRFSREVQKVTATLKAGKRVVGRGRLGRVTRSAKLNLRLSRKLKRGRYSLTVSATDGAGVTAIRTVRVNVRR